MKIDSNGDIHLHQSDLKTLFQCPEQFRLKQLVEIGSFENDAAYVGTVTHAVIEHEIQAPEPFATLGAAKSFAAETFLAGLEVFAATLGTVYRQETFGTHTKALAQLDVLVESWMQTPERRMLLDMNLDDFTSEWAFDIPFLQMPDGRTVWLAGSSDLLLPEHNQMWDWKTASGPYKQWELQRWGLQPSVYLWAGAAAGYLQPDDSGRYRFDFKVLVRRAKPVQFETYTVYRTEENFRWLADQVRRQVNMMDRLTLDTEWVTNDQHFLCGPKWCPFWSECKGALVSGDTWT